MMFFRKLNFDPAAVHLFGQLKKEGVRSKLSNTLTSTENGTRTKQIISAFQSLTKRNNRRTAAGLQIKNNNQVMVSKKLAVVLF